ncbi:60S ribosomal protein L23A [Saguinus oedipus]|uniref:60S ribosomal protein L23A n=1 Tax=Saguinus oedipus TaxID=9490 RepID=A0ABQ9VL31_SAGOE|nr:60S ribosomal protein L23A [Saguinus oedipus]
MVPKRKKEALAPPKAKANAKTSKAKKVVLTVVHSYTHTKRRSAQQSPHKILRLQRQPKYPQKSTTRRNKLDCYVIRKFLLTTESAMKKTEDNSALVFIVDVKANKRQVK